MIDLKDAKADIAAVKAEVRKAQTFLQNLADSIKQVFVEHKTEMLVAVGVGFAVGAVLF